MHPDDFFPGRKVQGAQPRVSRSYTRAQVSIVTAPWVNRGWEGTDQNAIWCLLGRYVPMGRAGVRVPYIFNEARGPFWRLLVELAL